MLHKTIIPEDNAVQQNADIQSITMHINIITIIHIDNIAQLTSAAHATAKQVHAAHSVMKIIINNKMS